MVTHEFYHKMCKSSMLWMKSECQLCYTWYRRYYITFCK